MSCIWIIAIILWVFAGLMFLISKKIHENYTILDEEIEELKNILKSKDIEIIEKKREKDLFENILQNIYGNDKKQKAKNTYFENVTKGKKFEEQIVRYFEKLKYEVDHRGKRLGIKDKGIDILAKYDEKYFLIQCKNYAPNNKIKHNTIKEFNSNCLDFINSSSGKLNNDNTKFIFICSHKESLDKSALYYFEDSNNKCEFQIMEYEN